MSFFRDQAAGIATGVVLTAAVTAGAGLLGLFERGKKTEPNALDPNMASHYAIDLWHGDRARFDCNACPAGSQFRIEKVELMRDKIVRQLDEIHTDLGNINGTDAVRMKVRRVKDLVGELPPRANQNPPAPSMPFDGWALPTAWTNQGETIDTTELPKNKIKPLKSSQFYSVTWTLRETLNDGSTKDTEYDPHIYAHGGKRR